MNGATYKGGVKEGRREGVGCLKLSGKGEEAVYEGEWVGDKKEGKGRLRVKAQEGLVTLEYEGEFMNDLYHGKGRLKTQVYEYEGRFIKGKRVEEGGDEGDKIFDFFKS